MNRIFNLIWSATKERWIVVSEKVKGNGKVPSSPLRSLAVLTALFAAGEPAYAIDPGSLPSGGKITSGSGSIATSGTQMTVNQSSQQLIANWNSFNIGSNAAVRFNQPNTAASALNRITDQNPTQIMGSLSSNGQVYLLNPSGIIFGKTARVDVGGLVATSLNMLDSDFIDGKNKFTTTGTAGSILNQGGIKAADGGVVALIAPKVTNEGTVTANSGTALLAAGNQVSLDFTGDGLISYTVDQGAVDAQVANKGLIKADGGVVVMTSKAADALRTATVSNTGVIEARTIQNKAGRILLLSDMQNGDTSVAGTLDASSPNGVNGGFIETSGSRVKVSDGSVVTTLAPYGKTGTWLLDPTDFTISSGSAAQTTSGIGATTLSTALGSNNVTITTSGTPTASNLGDIKVNAAVSWSEHTLTLSALNNIYINANLNGSGTANLALNFGQGSLAAGNTSTYTLASGAQVNLSAGQHFSTKQGSNGTSKSYTVITSLGTAADATTGSGQTLQGIARSSNLSGYFVLGSNIDATPTATWNSDGKSTPTYAGFTPIGSSQHQFAGIFDGLGHTVSSLTIKLLVDNVGLFGYSATPGVISNFGIIGGSVSGNQWVGSLAGYNRGGTIENCYASGNLKGWKSVGGLVGYNDGGRITNSYASVSVNGTINVGGLTGSNYGSITNSYAMGGATGVSNYIGGLVGINYSSGSITNSYAIGTVIGSGNVGGLVGYNYGSITNSYATGTVGGLTYYVGGLAGYNYGSITNCYATGSASGIKWVGGLVGENDAGTISTSYATASAIGFDFVGGLVGCNNNATISKSYSAGHVTGTGQLTVGGLVGYNYNGGTIINSFWDIETSFKSNGIGYDYNSPSGVTGLTTAQMHNASNFTNFNFTSTPGSTGNTWVIVNNDGTLQTANSSTGGATYPMLASEYSTTINNTHQLQLMQMDFGANYTLGSNINAAMTATLTDVWDSSGFVSIGNSNTAFTGTFDGLGHTIIGFTIIRPSTDGVGLFGYTSGAIISNVGLVGGSVSGRNYVGGLVGENFGGTITNSYATGNVTGSGYDVGGLVGVNYHAIHPSNINNCYAIGNVTGTDAVGGLVGFGNGGNITNCYATGNVTGRNNVGGLAGFNYGGGTITNCFWDITTSGQATSSGGTGVTSVQMMQLSTFSSWNTANPNTIANTGGSGAVWRIYEGHTAPLLTSFMTPLTLADAPDVAKTYNGKSQSAHSTSTNLPLLLGSVATGTNAGFYNGYYSIQQGYDITGGNLIINPKVVTPKVVTLKALKTYDGTTTLGAGTVTIDTGVTVGGITESLGYSGATAYSKNVADNAINYIKGITLLDGTGLASNYVLPSLNHTNAPVTITPKALNMIGLSVPFSKVYDGTTKAVVTGTKKLAVEAVGQGNATDGKSYTGDTVSITGTAVGSYNSKDVATASTVTYSGLSLTGSQAGNYTLTIQSPAIARITPKALTMSGLSVAASKVYDGTTNAVVTGTQKLAAAETAGTGTTADGKSYIGDAVSITGTAVGTYNSKDVATASKVTFSGLSLTGSQSGNYTLTIQSPASAKLTKKTVTLSASKTYDGTTTLGAGTVTIGTGVTLNGITELLGYSGATANSKNIADNATNYIKTITLLNGTGGLAANYALPTLNHVNAPVTIH